MKRLILSTYLCFLLVPINSSAWPKFISTGYWFLCMVSYTNTSSCYTSLPSTAQMVKYYFPEIISFPNVSHHTPFIFLSLFMLFPFEYLIVSPSFHFHFLSSNICISSWEEEKTGCVCSTNIATVFSQNTPYFTAHTVYTVPN